jgi:hypothetical protein
MEAFFPLFVALLEYLSACQLHLSGYYPKYQNGTLSSGF